MSASSEGGPVETALLDPSGQLIVTLKSGDQSASKQDVDMLAAQLARSPGPVRWP